MTTTTHAGYTKGESATATTTYTSGAAHCTTPQPDRSTHPSDTAYKVDVVDGNGIEVPGEPVTAHFELAMATTGS